jgi:maltooligosyltrehalose trehalohydrolase
MERHHDMPFGAQYRGRDVHFGLWAPAAHHVELRLEKANGFRLIALEAREQGWFELITDEARPGSTYQFRIDGAELVPDPASRFQPRDVHGPSEVVDPQAFDWQDSGWRGRPWEEAVIYEVHVGAFTPGGTFSGVREKLDYLADLGITALELMPVADFPGQRNWGYDGVFPFAPDSIYGRPEDLKELIQSAHSRELMVFLDVVYNHLGPEGNYLHIYAPQFFTDRHRTPWGEAVNFDGQESRHIRDFFIHNALYWLTEFHCDGLRLDAVHAIYDDSTPHILSQLAGAVRTSIGRDRYVHLILENDRNQARYLGRDERCRPKSYTAQWNDDIHHALHVLITGERDGYYGDYSIPLEQLGRCLVEGFGYQGESSAFRGGELRGEATAGLPPAAFVSFLQNHDQIGNRAFGERITGIADHRAVRSAMAILLLAPSPPLLFMGEEFAADTPFLFFCDFEKTLAATVTAGRRDEFARFARFRDPSLRARIPDPNALKTFEDSHLNWSEIGRHQDWIRFYRQLLTLRREHIVPLLTTQCAPQASCAVGDDGCLRAQWTFPNQGKLTLLVNLGANATSGLLPPETPPETPVIYASPSLTREDLMGGKLPPWCVVWLLAQ